MEDNGCSRKRGDAMTATQNVAEIAGNYHDQRGWTPIPNPYKTKNPGRDGWQNEKYNPAAFTRRVNIGVLLGTPSGNLVDVDLDCGEAIQLADGFLEPTPSEFGRKSARRSHRLYYPDPLPKFEKFTDPTAQDKDRATLVELRSNGQTIMPGSVHSSDETIEWDSDGEPAPVNGAVLRDQVARLAAAALLARHWKDGMRHDLSLALAGGLLNARWPVDRVEAFILSIARAAGDEEADDRVKNVQTTHDRIIADKDFTGWPRLAELTDDRIVKRVRDWLGITAQGQNLAVRSSSNEHAPAADESTLPEINAGQGHLPTITGQAWGALKRANDPAYLFRFGGLPSRIEHDDDGTPSPRTLTDTRLRHELARSADWFKLKKDGEGFARSSAMPPMPVVQDMLAHPNIPLPILAGIIEAPGFNPDGSLHSKPGYDPAGRTYYAPADRFKVPAIPQEPTPADVTRARSLILDELLCDFPFTDQAETAHAVGLLILPFVRGLIDGATPLHLIEKPTPGTGATLLTEVLTYPTTGRAITAMTEGRDEDEWRKRITAKLRGGGREMFIDNLKRPLISATLAAAMTATVWEDRLLGTSDTTRLPIRCTWIATGNNPTLSSEIARRTVRIRLDAKQDRPWQRASFRHADLRGWMKAHRAEIVWAALTLAQAWIAAGRPMPEGHQRIGMYESWSDVIGGILAHAGIPGFLSNLDDFYEQTDTEGEMIRSFLAGWWEAHGERSVGTADLYSVAITTSLDLGDGTERSQRTKLGNQLKELKDRVYQLSPELTVQIVKGKTVNNAQQWSLKRPLFVKTPTAESYEPYEPYEPFSPTCTAQHNLEVADISQNFSGVSVGKVTQVNEVNKVHPDTSSDQQMCLKCGHLIPDGPIARQRGTCNECEAKL